MNQEETVSSPAAQLVFLFSSWVQGCKEENEYEKLIN